MVASDHPQVLVQCTGLMGLNTLNYILRTVRSMGNVSALVQQDKIQLYRGITGVTLLAKMYTLTKRIFGRETF